MTEETEIIRKESGVVVSQDSSFAGVSIRAWLAIVLVGTVCGSHLFVVLGTVIDAVKTRDFGKIGTFTTIGEPLYSMSVAALGFYFGQKQAQK